MPQDALKNDLLLRAALRQPVERTPVWMMRQAGRYLPEYRAIRRRHDFLTMCKSPELAAEVSIQPVEILGVDGCIIFSDILVLPDAMGMQLVMEEGKGGPRFPEPLRNRGDIARLRIPDPRRDLPYVLEALRLTKERLAGRAPLIGFSGAPWTLAAYMVEGHGSKEFRTFLQMVKSDPDTVHLLLSRLTDAVSLYLRAQVEAGAQILQLFDTWAGLLPPEQFREFSLRYIRRIVDDVRSAGAPMIVFCKGAGHSLEAIADTGADIIGLDWTVDLTDARTSVGRRVVLQGNFDPQLLLTSPDRIRREVVALLEKFGSGPGHIFNLGHGMLPTVPVRHARAFVEAVKLESVRFHNERVAD